MRQIYLRPDEGKLNSARVIYRAKEGRAVGQLGKTCKALHLTPALHLHLRPLRHTVSALAPCSERVALLTIP